MTPSYIITGLPEDQVKYLAGQISAIKKAKKPYAVLVVSAIHQVHVTKITESGPVELSLSEMAWEIITGEEDNFAR